MRVVGSSNSICFEYIYAYDFIVWCTQVHVDVFIHNSSIYCVYAYVLYDNSHICTPIEEQSKVNILKVGLFVDLLFYAYYYCSSY